jgi:hypothetical protein
VRLRGNAVLTLLVLFFFFFQLWPAMWMLPVDSVYGAWPLSGDYPSFPPPLEYIPNAHSRRVTGEIDIVESRGNGLRYTAQYVPPPLATLVLYSFTSLF